MYQKTLVGKNLTLRQVSKDDVVFVYANWASDPEVTKYLTWPAHKSIGVTQAIMELWLLKRKDEAARRWMITLDGKEPIGMIDVVNYDHDKCPEIGYVLGRRYWHKGYMSEALGLVLEELFQEGFPYVYAAHDVETPRSGMVRKHNAMEFVEKKEKAIKRSDGKMVDILVYRKKNPQI